MDRYAVIGNPIAHSKSPRIHAAFARQTGQRLEYVRLLGEIAGFERNVRDFIAAGGRGLNVTVPFKEAAWRLADDCSEGAETAGAVNTLVVMEDGFLWGDNTDGVGLVRDLRDNQGATLRDARILLLGAGGAARGVLRPLLDAAPARLTIANRTGSKAERLAAGLPGRVQGCGLEGLAGMTFDLVINATAAGLGGEVPPLPDDILARDGWCYDLVYGDEPTPFMQWGESRGAAKALDGLGMLVEQAAESFFLWRGVRPDTRPVIAELRRG